MCIHQLISACNQQPLSSTLSSAATPNTAAIVAVHPGVLITVLGCTNAGQLNRCTLTTLAPPYLQAAIIHRSLSRLPLSTPRSTRKERPISSTALDGDTFTLAHTNRPQCLGEPRTPPLSGRRKTKLPSRASSSWSRIRSAPIARETSVSLSMSVCNEMLTLQTPDGLVGT
jgi:hypothetical protein